MENPFFKTTLICATHVLLCGTGLGQRQMENLTRGVAAVKKSTTRIYVSWRLFGNDPATVAFNLYRSANGAAAIKLNASPLTTTTDYTDTPAGLSTTTYAYSVHPVIDGAGSGALSPVINKFNTSSGGADRLWTLYNDNGAYSTRQAYGGRPAFWGDILGDWREELVLVASDYSEIRIHADSMRIILRTSIPILHHHAKTPFQPLSSIMDIRHGPVRFQRGLRCRASRHSRRIDQRGVRPMLAANLERPLRYTPEGGDFVIVNGDEFFNRPLYGGSSPFRVDAGDQPEFSFYLPGRGGNLRLGFATGAGMKWLHEAQHVEARYRGGSMVYEIRDPLLGKGALRVTAISPKDGEGLLFKVESAPANPAVELHLAFGGINGERGGRDGDIGCERLPVREFFRFQPGYCKGNEIAIARQPLHRACRIRHHRGPAPEGCARCAHADAESVGGSPRSSGLQRLRRPALPIAHAKFPLRPGASAVHRPAAPAREAGRWQVRGRSAGCLSRCRRSGCRKRRNIGAPRWSADDLPERFDREKRRWRTSPAAFP